MKFRYDFIDFVPESIGMIAMRKVANLMDDSVFSKEPRSLYLTLLANAHGKTNFSEQNISLIFGSFKEYYVTWSTSMGQSKLAL